MHVAQTPSYIKLEWVTPHAFQFVQIGKVFLVNAVTRQLMPLVGCGIVMMLVQCVCCFCCCYYYFCVLCDSVCETAPLDEAACKFLCYCYVDDFDGAMVNIEMLSICLKRYTGLSGNSTCFYSWSVFRHWFWLSNGELTSTPSFAFCWFYNLHCDKSQHWLCSICGAISHFLVACFLLVHIWWGFSPKTLTTSI